MVGTDSSLRPNWAKRADARTPRLYVRKSRKIAQAEFEHLQL